MTLIRIDLRHPTATGTRPAAGSLAWTPTRRRSAADHILLPTSFQVPLTEGRATVDLAPTGTDWCWRVQELLSGGGGSTRYVNVPDTEAVAEYATLPDVDPATLQPAPEPLAGWTATLAEVQAVRDEIYSLSFTHIGDGVYRIGEMQ